ncbi:cystathionine gamma-synthase [Pseudomonas amygdali pv. tabaci str. ATCC 11528]|uniref:Lead uptake protein n=5 Tax=Pseudomonas syringae group genomosp. 2 TaxID=251698 RepID=A0AAX1VQI4_PSEAJ|nr:MULTISPECIES: cytochrome c/FTR1 family iron permease [Pseudomonas syringae group]ARA78663.1 cystathionine gamma-synthase [Pseudomonas amygdali pv. lachrymans]AXH58890.1 cystathionine gamma-synthase [Pseudomonas amygdali pv. lachrymans str. M301315]KEZ29058.1 cystathionine gamma-synthase [Pseudomonas amygdali pv. tabaci str. 6605]KEZ66124.1 cystathionine gamma-synthase [Pseudomonas amygdali pv. tabaci str. ATCC 11528]KIY16131.1 cystathionine gamma-synthase [Pseudomonas amygdali pv. tabaci]
MPVRSRFLAWLLLPLLALGSCIALADPVEGAAQALHLLDYLGADYPATVADGKVVNSAEYQQQVDNLAALQGLVVALPQRAERADLERAVTQLKSAVAGRQDGAQVARQARQLSAKLALAYEVSQAPAITPDPARGAPLYAQHCSVCHGDSGAGDGPAGIGLEPPPSNLRDTARLDRLSLYDLYNATGLGIAGTDMPAFADQLDDRQRWDIATYIASFSAQPVANPAKTFNIADLARQTPAEVQTAEGPDASATFRVQRAQPPQVQRGPAQLLDYTSVTLDKSLAAYKAGDREQAYDLSVAAYLEGFELVESSLDNVDANVRKDTEKSLMAYRQSLQDSLPLAQVAQKLEAAKGKLKESAGLLGSDGLSLSLSYVSGLLILLREGLEAILVLAAILAFLRNTGQQSAVRSVNIGWGLALLAGLGTWALAAYVIDVSGAQRELLEGATALFASVMVLWLGVWMHDRRHAAAWQDYVKSSLVGGGGRFGFAVLAFFSVYRELFEVILFYETLWLQAGPAGHDAVLAGGATALVLLVGLAWVILRGSAKLPLSLFFGINAALLCALSVVFAGHGVKALQEAGIFGTRPVPFFEFDWLGIHADLYSLSAQAIALIAIAVLYGRSRLAEKRRLQTES